MTRVYLAVSGNLARRGLGPEYPWDTRPVSLLVSYVYLRDWERAASWARPERLMLDSGAYSAWKSGKVIDMAALAEETKDPRWHESVGLDVIGDPAASFRNALAMQSLGSPAMPVFHYGEPWAVLDEYRKRFPKVGLSCRFGEPVNLSVRWVGQCFARGWPHRFHSFGWVDEDVLSRFPFHSADTANWAYDPGSFGKWKAFGCVKNGHKPGANAEFRAFSKPMRSNGVMNFRAEVEYYLRLQSYLRHLWGRELAALGGAA